MNYKEVRKILEKLQKNNYKDLIKAIISMELNIDDEIFLNKTYDYYMGNDEISLISDEIIKFSI